ncbi:hypothetical protein BKP35_17530 [Anaerobacillus arseniciselenatis]|uniref:DinB-like domain-containing protein n=1 Tax=Anaerobacillus arseniciselenatis TaxID=85682 RepID=A0A1S2L8W3_9BACI|nr:DinB family protein [Anaerobacillus arseniciselenatis]OIJ08710.1 hypothetical protein BKP35_17530 [Anaerobacillus arseniciselenatis]
MDHFLFTQLEFVRNKTLTIINEISEEEADFIPEGFKNNIRWHLGHIYFVNEKFLFSTVGLPMEMPDNFSVFFAPGTSPLTWKGVQPTIQELGILLEKQQQRIKETLKERLHEKVNQPITLKSGLKLETTEQFLSFNLYHEGVHLGTTECIRKLYK